MFKFKDHILGTLHENSTPRKILSEIVKIYVCLTHRIHSGKKMFLKELQFYQHFIPF